MKRIALVLLVIAEVFGGEKENAKNAVVAQFDILMQTHTNVMNTIKNEQLKSEPDQEQQTQSEVEKNVKLTLNELEANVLESTKTAIAKGKGLAAIECIVKVDAEGKGLIKEFEENFRKQTSEILPNKIRRLDFGLVECNLIKSATARLEEEALMKIEAATSGFEALKSDALKKFESAKKQLTEIEGQATKPYLSEEYIALRKQIESKYKEIKETLLKKLQKCVA